MPYYIAPELIIGESYGVMADYWSLGICVYELLCGGLPFGDSLQNPLDIYEEIIKGQVFFPSFFECNKSK